MGKGKHRSKYRIVRDRAKQFYFKRWRGKEKICPALGEPVYATRSGWDHIVFQKRRNTSEQMRRLKVLPLAKKLLETSTTFQEHRRVNHTHYFALAAWMNGIRIKVVVRSKGMKRKKYFYSVIVFK